MNHPSHSSVLILIDGVYSSKTKQWEGLPTSIVEMSSELYHPKCTHSSLIGKGIKESDVVISKSIVHPGEVNKMKTCPQHRHILATHSDGPHIYLWNMQTQEHTVINNNAAAAVPDLILEGHEDVSEFALSFCDVGPLIASGGKDNKVLVWNIEDYESSLASGVKSSLSHTHALIGHTSVVEDVQFQPGNKNILASGGDDKACRVWDLRSGAHETNTVLFADDVNAISWNPLNVRQFLVGSSDGRISVIDTRRHGREMINSIAAEQGPIQHLSWALHNTEEGQYFASSGETKVINVWDANELTQGKKRAAEPVFRHYGHRGMNNLYFHFLCVEFMYVYC